MLQERESLVGLTVELVQSVTIALLVAFLALAVLVGAMLGFAWARAKLGAEKIRSWYAEIATRRVMNDAKRSQRVNLPDRPPPSTLRTGSPQQPMKLANTPQPPPLPTIPIEAAKPPPAPPRPRSRPLSAVELAQTSSDWSDDHRKTQRTGSPPSAGNAVPGAAVPFDAHTSKTQRLPRPRPDAEVGPHELDFSDFEDSDKRSFPPLGGPDDPDE